MGDSEFKWYGTEKRNEGEVNLGTIAIRIDGGSYRKMGCPSLFMLGYDYNEESIAVRKHNGRDAAAYVVFVAKDQTVGILCEDFINMVLSKTDKEGDLFKDYVPIWDGDTMIIKL